MAHITTRHLNCEESEKFLISQGYFIHQHHTKSMWFGPGVVLYLDVSTVIRNMSDLNIFICKQSYDAGRGTGKQDALNIISNHFSHLIFPPQKINPTC